MKKFLIFICVFFFIIYCGMALNIAYLTGYYDGFEKARLALTKGQSCNLPYKDEE